MISSDSSSSIESDVSASTVSTVSSADSSINENTNIQTISSSRNLVEIKKIGNKLYYKGQKIHNIFEILNIKESSSEETIKKLYNEHINKVILSECSNDIKNQKLEDAADAYTMYFKIQESTSYNNEDINKAKAVVTKSADQTYTTNDPETVIVSANSIKYVNGHYEYKHHMELKQALANRKLDLKISHPTVHINVVFFGAISPKTMVEVENYNGQKELLIKFEIEFPTVLDEELKKLIEDNKVI